KSHQQVSAFLNSENAETCDDATSNRFSGCCSGPSLSSQWIRSHLEMNDLPLGTLSAFDVPDEVRTVVGPETTSLPVCRIGIVDTSIHTARIETERIRNAEMDPRIVLSIEREQRIRIRSCREWRILAQSRNVLLVHPIEVLEVRRNIRALQLRTVCRIERPAF